MAAARVGARVEVAVAVAEVAVAAAVIVGVAVETMIKKIRSVERVGGNIVIIGTTTVAFQSMEKHNKCENDARKKREIIQKRESLMKT